VHDVDGMTKRSIFLLISIGAISAGCQDGGRRSGSGKSGATDDIDKEPNCAPFESSNDEQDAQETGGDAEPEAPKQAPHIHL
jgi:hypothetical protein